ncbi:phosphoribosyltransferase family protein [Spirillospora sp. CA-294931]|uniref:phosphoribosyltransferase family protein n=1 Tax=Spirillospora sp. CA-294931 TaxID=3240042 RepID=UPI003D8C17EE
MNENVWSGAWVAERLGVRIVGEGLPGLVGMAVRRNPRRAHLLVSTVLGKHVPTDPRVVYGAGIRLGGLVRARLDGDDAIVLGYAETATALGHSVADALAGAYYLHSTRRPVPGFTPYGAFEEEHSHATSHLMLPADPAMLDRDVPLVLVDDELSTGRTVLNTIEALHAVRPRGHYVVAALVDLRGEADWARMRELEARLGARIETVALAAGRVELPDDILDAGRALVDELEQHGGQAVPGESHPVMRADLMWPEDLPDGGRHGFLPEHRARLEKELPAMAERVADLVEGRRVLVLGFEELMYAPLRLAEALADALPDVDVRYSTTTRSPVLAVDEPGYAIRTRLVFPAHDDPADGPGDRYAYNVAGGGFDAIVLMVDDAGDTEALSGGLLERLAQLAPVVLAAVPSYRGEPAP